ncbi:MAG: hypothetical protein LN588_06165 [Rickettsia endosymbiont of Bryobia graminum]|nr:hypothetical protein [Rickettsia endosymbiont of Bryobia graminum]
MKNNLLHIDVNKLKKSYFYLLIIIPIIYIGTIVVLYKYYDDKFRIEKEEILQKYHRQISNKIFKNRG